VFRAEVRIDGVQRLRKLVERTSALSDAGHVRRCCR
jgi:hypothetical protein